MSFEDYAQHIYQKHRLAISLAIIRTKPPDMSLHQYIDELKAKVDETDSTVCSDDFVMDNDDDIVTIDDDMVMTDDVLNNSETILKDFDMNQIIDCGNAVEGSKAGIDSGQTLSLEDLTQSTNIKRQTYLVHDEFKNNFVNDNNTTNMVLEESTVNYIPKSDATPLPNKEFHINKIDYNLKTDDGDNTKTNELLKTTQDTYYDSQKTILYTVHGFTQNYTHFSPSQDIVNIPNNQIFGSNSKEKTINKDINHQTVNIYSSDKHRKIEIHGTKNIDTIQDGNLLSQVNDDVDNVVTDNNDNYNNTSNINNDKDPKNINSNNKDYDMTQSSQGINEYFHDMKSLEEIEVPTPNANTQLTEFDIIDEMYENTQDFSILDSIQSDYFDLEDNSIAKNPKENEVINKNDIINVHSYKNNLNLHKDIHKKQIVKEFYNSECKNIEGIAKNLNINEKIDTNKTINVQNYNNNENINKDMSKTDAKTKEMYNNVRKNIKGIAKNLNVEEIDKTNSINVQNNNNYHNINKDIAKNHTTTKEMYNNESKNIKNYEKSENNTENIEENVISLTNIEQNNEIEDDKREMIPFKVLEELNKIKKFLNKQDKDRRSSTEGYSTDSGYRSGSQTRLSNRSALQLSCTSLNQSAYCIYNFLLQSPCVEATREINKEIAKTLGQLIDRLHEQELYPKFLEELLETVDLLLRQIYEGNNIEDYEFLTKDENLQRLYLLNTSIHIQKHSIEKITHILKLFHANVTEKNSTYDLTHINEIENLSYIFQILEILLKKYLKNKHLFSQKCSQDEQVVLKKSSITDIWKRKWNPNYKEHSNEGSCEKKCVLKECSDVLNKIIVDCVNEYSLVAFSALNCFNLIQS